VERKENVTLSEIEWVVNRLGLPDQQSPGDPWKAVWRWRDRFMVNCHNRGNKQVKQYSVQSFADAMIDLELYED
jgi:hypothetical protein